MIGRLLRQDEEERWDRWLASLGSSNVRQSSGYREALRLYRHRSEILVVEKQGRIVGGALLAIRPGMPGLGSVVRTSGGVALADEEKLEGLRWVLGACLEYARASRACCLEVSLRIPDRGQDGVGAFSSLLRSEGFRFARPTGTYVVDLSTKSEAELLARMGEGVRRDVRKAAREGVAVERSVDPADFVAFEDAMRHMERRKGVAAPPPGLVSQVLGDLARKGAGDLFVARQRGIPLNFAFVSSIGDPTYQWGALTAAAHETLGVPTGQITHYEAMCYYRNVGRKRYDLGGSPGPVPDPSHPNYGVWRFKHSFRGCYVSFVGTWRFVLRPASWTVLELLRKRDRRAR